MLSIKVFYYFDTIYYQKFVLVIYVIDYYLEPPLFYVWNSNTFIEILS